MLTGSLSRCLLGILVPERVVVEAFVSTQINGQWYTFFFQFYSAHFEFFLSELLLELYCLTGEGGREEGGGNGGRERDSLCNI